MNKQCARFFSVLLVAMVVSSASFAELIQNQQQLKNFVSMMADKHQFDGKALGQLLAGAERKQSIIDAISRPAEKTLDWNAYRKIFIKPKRISQGKAFMTEYRDVLERAEQTYGVPKAIIAAVIGVETYYGRHKGKYRVLDSLATLAFDYPPRSRFFTSELEAFLLLSKEQGFQPEELRGSYAGAMGYGQFISSSYRHYAVDFDGDNVADIINNPIDAIGSVANYFARHGWKTGEPVCFTATKLDNFESSKLKTGLKPKQTLSELKAAGLDWKGSYSADDLATGMLLQGEQGEEAWIGLKNFYVITRYNHSRLYAMAVFQLSELLKS